VNGVWYRTSQLNASSTAGYRPNAQTRAHNEALRQHKNQATARQPWEVTHTFAFIDSPLVVTSKCVDTAGCAVHPLCQTHNTACALDQKQPQGHWAEAASKQAILSKHCQNKARRRPSCKSHARPAATTVQRVSSLVMAPQHSTTRPSALHNFNPARRKCALTD
jgi:hypothetical protein